MAGNFIYIIVLIIVVFVFLIVPVGLLAKMVFSRANDSVSIDELTEMEEQIKALLLEMQSTVEKNVNLLDDRISSLRELLKQADGKVASLDRQTGAKAPKSNSVKISEPALRASSDSGALKQPDEKDEIYGKIEKMALAGIKIEDIARELNMHTGEIQLLLGLRGLQAGEISKHKSSKSGS